MAANHVNVSWSIMMFSSCHTSHHNACRPCTGAHRRDFLLGIRCGQPAGAHVRFRCSRHRRSLATPSELARPANLYPAYPRTRKFPGSMTRKLSVTSSQRRCQSLGTLLTQEVKDRRPELGEARVAFVVSDMPMHQRP